MTKNSEVFSGNILLFYSYDIGDDIDIEKVRKRKILPEKLVPLSPYFKNYNVPFSFKWPLKSDSQEEARCIVSKLYRFGVLSFCYEIPFNCSFDGLKTKLIDLHSVYEKKSDRSAKMVFDKVVKATDKPTFFHLKNSYYVVNVTPEESHEAPEAFKNKHAHHITSLLRLEKARLSEYQKKDILSTRLAYSDSDFLIIDSEASFSYDDEYKELLEFFEMASIQKLELQYFDRVLDKRLEYFYLRPYKIPLIAYVPLLSGRVNIPAQALAKLRVDISVITERLESSIKMEGDAYFSKVYSTLVEQLALGEWKTAINNKLDIIKDFYTVYQHRLETVHAEILEVVIIILIALELVHALMK